MSDERGPSARPGAGDGAGAQADSDDAGPARERGDTGAGRDDQPGATDEERVRAVVEELRRLRVRDLALDMAVSLVTVGYQKLGLTEQTRELRDLDEARLSIELLRASLDVLERERGAEGLADLRSTLAAMQLNYALAAGEGASAAEERGAESPAGEHLAGESPAGEGPGDAPPAGGDPAEGASPEGASSAGDVAGDD